MIGDNFILFFNVFLNLDFSLEEGIKGQLEKFIVIFYNFILQVRKIVKEQFFFYILFYICYYIVILNLFEL